MSIIISGGVGSAGGSAGIYKFLQAPKINVPDPDPTKFVEIWERGSATKQRPRSITILYWGPGVWMTRDSGTAGEDHPPDCGASFGTVTLRGSQIPEKLYYWRGNHQATYPYTYAKHKTGGFNGSATRDGAWLLPNATGNSQFNRTDFIAPDAVGHHWGNWDAVYNGGNGHWWERQTPNGWITSEDSPGSNASIFGPGKTTTGDGNHYPASCGGSGTGTERGPLAHGVAEPAILEPLGALRPYAVETIPSTWTDSDKKHNGGIGSFGFEMPNELFGLAGGCPIDPTAGLQRIAVGGGPPPRARRSQDRDYYVTLIVLFEYAK